MGCITNSNIFLYYGCEKQMFFGDTHYNKFQLLVFSLQTTLCVQHVDVGLHCNVCCLNKSY